MSDRVILGVFIALVAGGCALIWAPLESHYANDPFEKARRGEIRGLDELSMLRAGNAVRALEEVRRRAPVEVRIQTLTFRPTSVLISIVEPGTGEDRDYDVDPAFRVGGGEPSVASSDYGATFRAIDASVPERMAREVLALTHRDADEIDYVSAATSSTGDPVQWLLYFASGRIRDRVWRAEADGSNVRRNGT